MMNGTVMMCDTRFVGMSGGSESLAAHVHPELKDCAKAVSILLSLIALIRQAAVRCLLCFDAVG